MSKPRILIIEDEKDIVKIVRYNLEKEGYAVQAAFDGETGLKLARQDAPDLLILDIMLPKMDGLEVCRQLRTTSRVPILILSVKKAEIDRVVGLEIGADDYLTKPFGIRELLARVRALLRRSAPAPVVGQGVERLGSLEMDLERYTLTLRGKPVPLSSKEFDLLKVLVLADGKALTREQLLEKVWTNEAAGEIDTRTVDQHIARLRGKLGTERDRLITVKSIGYRFDKS